jgi:hypothetical protein
VPQRHPLHLLLRQQRLTQQDRLSHTNPTLCTLWRRNSWNKVS